MKKLMYILIACLMVFGMVSCSDSDSGNSGEDIQKVATPVADPVAGQVNYGTTVALSTATAGAKIYYTTDGYTPTSNSTEYTAPISIKANTLIKAIAVKQGMKDSEVLVANYPMAMLGTVAAPSVSPAAGAVNIGTAVALSSTTPSATIYYTTNGSTPSRSSDVYSSAITVSAATTIKAFAVKEGYNDSPVTTAAYTIAQVVTPVATPVAGAVAYGTTVALTTTTPGASIYYTDNGSAPSSTNGTLYTTAIPITSAVTIRAIGVKSDMTNSGVLVAAYTVTPVGALADPAFSHDPATPVLIGTPVTITADAGADIYYTTDGSTPSSTNGTLYDAAISITSAVTIKAIAVRAGYTSSNVVTAVYTIAKSDEPIAAPIAGDINHGQSVVLTAGSAEIYYTTDGTPPDIENASQLYNAPIVVTGAFDSTFTIKAVAVEANKLPSDVETFVYTIKPAGTLNEPTPSPAVGAVTIGTEVTLSSDTGDAKVYYTTDVSKSTVFDGTWTLYENPIAINVDTTIWAIAVLTGHTNSTIAGPFAYTIKQVKPLTATPATGSEVLIDDTIKLETDTLTEGAHVVKIYFTYDDSAFDSETPNWTLYSEEAGSEVMPVITATQLKVRAIAVRDDMKNSDVLTATYTIKQVETPEADTTDGSQVEHGEYVEFDTATPGATIYYTTDNSEPDATNLGRLPYIPATGIQITGNIGATFTIKAIAEKDKMLPSEVLTVAYTIKAINTLAIPEAAPVSGTEVEIGREIVLSAAAGATIHYTDDGSEPDETSPVYIPGDTVIKITNTAAPTVIKAIAVQAGYTASSVLTATYTIKKVATPVASELDGETVNYGAVITFTPIAGATIYYTLGSIDLTDDTNWIPANEYEAGVTPIEIIGNSGDMVTLKAIAVDDADLLAPSELFSATYTIAAFTALAKPEAAPVSGTEVEIGDTVELTATAGAKIYYTTDIAIDIEDNSNWIPANEYTAEIEIDEDTTIWAIAVQAGWDPSPMLIATYTIVQVAKPTADPVAGAVSDPTPIKLETETSGAVIYYTRSALLGNDPASFIAIHIDDTGDPMSKWVKYNEGSKPEITTMLSWIFAIAEKPNMKNSEILNAQYTITP